MLYTVPYLVYMLLIYRVFHDFWTLLQAVIS